VKTIPGKELGSDSPDAKAVLDFLSGTVPFRFLKDGLHRDILAAGELRGYASGETLMRQGAKDSDGVFLLLSGSVESVDSGRAGQGRVNVIEAGNYFGERRTVFDTPRQYEVRALEDCSCFLVKPDSFRLLIQKSRAFAQALGQILREGQGIFAAFERFTSEVVRDVALGHLELRRLLPLYQALEPALHSGAQDEGRIDLPALLYAARRLPENVTRSFVYLLTDELPFMYAHVDKLFTFIPSEARHRFIYEMLPGKDMVLVRSGLSDLMDFVTCLCIFTVETRKIRYRLNHPDIVHSISEYVRAGADARPPADEFLSGLPFSEEERGGLQRIWPEGTVERLQEIGFNRQAYSLDIRKQTNNYNARLSELWTQEVGDAAQAFLGMRPTELPEDFEVHVVSSNTHSVSNCLNPFFSQRAREIFSWAEHSGRKTAGWANPYDELYSLARAYMRDHPELIQEMRDSERGRGILRLPETVTTGIQVQLIDSSLLRPGLVDPGVGVPDSARKSLIVNIDYAFGEQAQDILRSLIMLFGPNIASINVLGKAGALLGKRGDVLAPNAFIEQKSDTIEILGQPCPPECARSLTARLGGAELHSGPLLTVGGTLLQNRLMLNFYKSLWGCVGLEMEGIYYHWAIAEALQLGVLRKKVATRFLYYVSDLPLLPGASLSERLSPQEGIPPLYAITREILSRILA
jgi:CRP-like cAMP-binding protein